MNLRNLAILALLPLASCATFIGGDLTKPGEPVGTLIVRNESGVGVDVITISKCNAMSYGLNRLSSGDVIAHGTQRSWAIGAGCWDVQAGRTGTCSANSCSWLQATQRMNIAAGQGNMIIFGATQN
jgi:hypothetical protein